MKLVAKLYKLRVLTLRMSVVVKLLKKLPMEQAKLLLKKRNRTKTATYTSSVSGRSQSQRSPLLKNLPRRRLLRKTLTKSR